MDGICWSIVIGEIECSLHPRPSFLVGGGHSGPIGKGRCCAWSRSRPGYGLPCRLERFIVDIVVIVDDNDFFGHSILVELAPIWFLLSALGRRECSRRLVRGHRSRIDCGLG